MLKGIMGAIFEESEATPQTEQVKTSVKSPAQSAPVTAPVFNSVNNAIISAGNINQKFLDHFHDVMNKANIPGPDYFEFQKALDAASTMQVAEDVKFKFIFSTMSASGALTKDKLVETANQYLEVLNDESTGFSTELEAKRAQEIDGRQKSITDIDAINQEKANMIEQLSKEISENNIKRVELQNEIATKSVEIDQKKKDFDVTYQLFVNRINEDIAKIKSNI
jgi:hypothetical protein